MASKHDTVMLLTDGREVLTGLPLLPEVEECKA